MTAFDDGLSSLRSSGERILDALITLGGRALTDEHLLAAAERARREVRQARAVGELTVLIAVRKLRRPTHSPAPTTDGEPPPAPLPPEPSGIAAYSTLSASQVVPLLGALTATERAEVLRFEEATRKRKTILSALRRAQ